LFYVITAIGCGLKKRFWKNASWETSYRLESREGEIPFKNHIKTDNTNLGPGEAALMIKEYFKLPGA
jgi:hypothetical protein